MVNLSGLHAVLILTMIACLTDARGDSLFAQQPGSLRSQAHKAARKAVSFLDTKVSTRGGYLWRYSGDLKLREGEGVITSDTIWTQPPGTPTVGEAILDLFEATEDPLFLAAATRTGEALLQGQMLSGGWQASVEFDPQRRLKWAYRSNEKQHRRAKDQSSLDDDKTQACLRFLTRLDQAKQFQEEAIHEAVLYGLEGLLAKGQFRNGGFPQVYTSDLKAEVNAQVSLEPASFPATWPKEYPGHQEYWYRLTLNDNLAPDVMAVLLLADQVYGGDTFRNAAIELGDFLIQSQLPDPQPAWAQQYSYAMQPIWARKFEPPAITGSESNGVIRTLMAAYQLTGDTKYLEPIPKALDYLERSEIAPGKLARFYELESNRPLYFTRDYRLTYDASDVPTHYAFQVGSAVAKLRKQYDALARGEELGTQILLDTSEESPSDAEIRGILDRQDARGAWVSEIGLRYHKKPGEVIDMRETVQMLKKLAAFLR